MGAMAMPLLIGSTVLQMGTAISGGRAADKLGQFQAQQLEQKAGQERSVSQRKADSVRRKARFAESRALALAAASGGGASDPTVVNIMSGIAGEGEIASQTALYEGEERARGLEMAAETARYEGKQAKRAGYIKAGTTLMSSIAAGSSLTEKYAEGFAPGDAYMPAYPRY